MLLGYAADRLFGDPRRGHPVAGFGSVAAVLERRSYRDSRSAGALHTGLLVGAVVGIGGLAGRGGTLAVAAGTWTVLGGASLATTGEQMATLLAAGDPAAARAVLPTLCGRDPAGLDADGLARAALESVAENTSDAAVAPLLWGAVAGLPGLLGYRAVNTLDAMIGYRNVRYRRFGWAAARTDDVANYLPARVTGLLTVVLAPLVGGRSAAAWSAWRADAADHPSPNAGVVEAATAGALAVQLGGRTEYPHGVELRPLLGSGPPPHAADLRRAVRLSRLVQLAAVVGSAGLAVAVRQLGFGGRRR
ncbi:cobalamin biosynthesis protein [Skermania piniformis]|uniref:Cobalamin biosynthesis protein CobD n=1 Tax=Skermania pinensis TaxID=39122 RepID=A0ABX8SJ50_9ACTN|nr:cobalamin biosynthesis protein [Skermania piniformis]